MPDKILPPTFREFPKALYVPVTQVSARVGGIVDGDTIDCFIHFGRYFPIYPWNRIRLWGVDAPEKNDPDPIERQAALDSMLYLSTLIPAGAPCRLNIKGLDPYARLVTAIDFMTPEGIKDIGTEMVNAGHGLRVNLVGTIEQLLELHGDEYKRKRRLARQDRAPWYQQSRGLIGSGGG